VAPRQYLNVLLGFVEALYIVLLAWLATAGPGSISLDRLAVRAIDAAERRRRESSATAPARN